MCIRDSTVTWAITVFNQGTIAAADVNVIDFLPSGLEVADPNWTETANGDAVINIAGPIPPGGQALLMITTRVVDGTDLDNVAEISGALAIDANGDPLTNADGSAILDIDSVADAINSDVRVDDVIDNAGSDEDDNDGATLILAVSETPPVVTTTPPSPPLAVTGVESRQLVLLSLLFLLTGALFFAASRRDKEEEAA